MDFKKLILFVSVSLISFTLFSFIYIMSKGSSKLKVGDIAPDFSLKNQNGETVSLSDYTGKSNIVIFFYPKDDSPGCTAEACSFRDRYDVFKEKGAEVIGISKDDTQSHSGFAQKHGLPFELLSDTGGKVAKEFGVENTFFIIPGRVTFVIDKERKVQHIFSSQVQATKHIDEALKVLDKL
jgi:peroxiredoxin Q/BCP